MAHHSPFSLLHPPTPSIMPLFITKILRWPLSFRCVFPFHNFFVVVLFCYGVVFWWWFLSFQWLWASPKQKCLALLFLLEIVDSVWWGESYTECPPPRFDTPMKYENGTDDARSILLRNYSAEWIIMKNGGSLSCPSLLWRHSILDCMRHSLLWFRYYCWPALNFFCQLI